MERLKLDPDSWGFEPADKMQDLLDRIDPAKTEFDKHPPPLTYTLVPPTNDQKQEGRRTTIYYSTNDRKRIVAIGEAIIFGLYTYVDQKAFSADEKAPLPEERDFTRKVVWRFGSSRVLEAKSKLPRDFGSMMELGGLGVFNVNLALVDIITALLAEAFDVGYVSELILGPGPETYVIGVCALKFVDCPNSVLIERIC